MTIEKLSGDFIRGYTKAIQDISLENRENIREDTNGFIRWNCVTNKFEWFKRSE